MIENNDDFFIDDDTSLTTPEIDASPVDASVSIQVKEVSAQVNKMRSAVEKLFNAYNTTYSKDAFKRQFDIYPMKDFDKHMADLGATRTSNGRHFVGVGDKVDWVAVVKKHLDDRNAKRKAYEAEKEAEEVEKLIENPKIVNETVKKDTDAITDYTIQALGPFINDKSFVDLLKNNEAIKIALLKQDYTVLKSSATLGKYFTDKNIDILTKFLNDKDFKKKSEDKDIESQEDIFVASSVSKETKTKKDELKLLKDGRNKVETDELPEYDKKIKDLEKDIRKSEKNVNDLIKGVAVTYAQHKAMMMGIGTKDERIFNNKYDGFTTVGPFCVEKRDYFLNVYLPSIDHIDTEDREIKVTPVAARDIGNGIIEIKHKPGSSGAQDTQDGDLSLTDAATGPGSFGAELSGGDPGSVTNNKNTNFGSNKYYLGSERGNSYAQLLRNGNPDSNDTANIVINFVCNILDDYFMILKTHVMPEKERTATATNEMLKRMKEFNIVEYQVNRDSAGGWNFVVTSFNNNLLISLFFQNIYNNTKEVNEATYEGSTLQKITYVFTAILTIFSLLDNGIRNRTPFGDLFTNMETRKKILALEEFNWQNFV